MDKLDTLLSGAQQGDKPFIRGYVPTHYKRIHCKDVNSCAVNGGAVLLGDYGVKPYYTQAVIAGACLSEDISKIVVVTPSQYGKSWLMGHVALSMAHKGHNVHIVASTGYLANIIMRYVTQAAGEAAQDIQAELIGTGGKIDKLQQTLSKRAIAFSTGGSVDALSLGDAFGDISKNNALGRGGDYIIDEAALVSHESMVELGRREFSNVDGKKEKLIMISNPHKAGDFMDALTDEYPKDDTCIIWMDALTAVQEGRFTSKQVLESAFAKDSFRRKTYLLCELDTSGSAMFGEIKESEPMQGLRFLGVDAAYKGKDNIVVAVCTHGDGLRIDDVQRIEKGEWIDGVTSESIVDDIARIYAAVHASLVCCDIGYGAWIIEGLSKKGVNVEGINFGSAPTPERVKANHYSARFGLNMRAEMHLDLQDLIDSDKITFSPEAAAAVRREMSYVTSTRKANGKVQIRPKAEIKAELRKSPDELDAVLLAIHSAIVYSGNETEFIT